MHMANNLKTTQHQRLFCARQKQMQNEVSTGNRTCTPVHPFISFFTGTTTVLRCRIGRVPHDYAIQLLHMRSGVASRRSPGKDL